MLFKDYRKLDSFYFQLDHIHTQTSKQKNVIKYIEYN